MYVLLKYLQVARAQTLAIPVLVSILAYSCNINNPYLNLKAYIFTVISSVLFLIAVNTLSEYRDCVIGLDNNFADSTKYRLVTGILPKKNVLLVGYISFLCATLSGIIAVTYSTYTLIIPGLIGALIVWGYSEGIKLKYHAMGEVAVFTVYGILLGWSYILSLTGSVHLKNILIFIPGGILVTCILLANNIRDYKYDLYKVKTLATILGIKESLILLYVMANIAYLLYLLLIWAELLPNKSYIVFFSYPLLVWSVFKCKSQKNINLFGLLFVLTELLIILSFYM